MEATNQSSSGNDYAVAKKLYAELLPITDLIIQAGGMDVPEDYKIEKLNRAYVLLVHELEELYEKNPELTNIKPRPFWFEFDILKTNTWKMHDYFKDKDFDSRLRHEVQLDKLCIISDSKNPAFSPKQKKLIETIKEAIADYKKILYEARLEINQRIEESAYIPEYKLEYKPDGTILINEVLILKKTHIDSAIDRILEQAVKNPNKVFIPDLGRTSRNLSTILSSAGFTPTLRQLFFPIVSESKGVLFRPVVSLSQAIKDNINTTRLDIVLMYLDADHTFSE